MRFVASRGRKAFDSNCEDIERLLEIHGNLAGPTPGRKYKVEVLNKSAIVLITAFWEAYCEDIAAEGLETLVEHSPDATKLPKELRKSVAKELGADKNDLAVWSLSGDGWRDVLRARLTDMQAERNRRLNTPKSAQIDELFEKALGIRAISRAWHWPGMSAQSAAQKLDRHVERRGSIAHRGTASGGVKKSQVTDYYEHVMRLVGKTGGRVNSEVRRATGHKIW